MITGCVSFGSFDFKLELSSSSSNGQSNQIYFCELVVDPNDRLVSERDRKVVVRFFGSELTGQC